MTNKIKKFLSSSGVLKKSTGSEQTKQLSIHIYSLFSFFGHWTLMINFWPNFFNDACRGQSQESKYLSEIYHRFDLTTVSNKIPEWSYTSNFILSLSFLPFPGQRQSKTQEVTCLQSESLGLLITGPMCLIILKHQSIKLKQQIPKRNIYILLFFSWLWSIEVL